MNASYSSSGRTSAKRVSVVPFIHSTTLGRRRQVVRVHLQPHVLGRPRRARRAPSRTAPGRARWPRPGRPVASRSSPRGTARWPPPGWRPRAPGGRRCTAPAAPAARRGASASHQRASTAAWFGTHCKLALREDEVVVAATGPLGDVAAGEAQPVVGRADELAGAGEHRVGRVDADHLVDPELLGHRQRQLTRAAPEVDTASEAFGVGERRARPTRSQNGCDRSAANWPY